MARRCGDVDGTSETKETDSKVAKAGQCSRSVAGADWATIFVKGHISHIVETILNLPLAAIKSKEGVQGRILIAMPTILGRIAEDGLQPDIDRLAGPEYLGHVRDTHERYDRMVKDMLQNKAASELSTAPRKFLTILARRIASRARRRARPKSRTPRQAPHRSDPTQTRPTRGAICGEVPSGMSTILIWFFG